VTLLFNKVYIIQWVRGLGRDSGSVEVSGSIPLSSTIFIYANQWFENFSNLALVGTSPSGLKPRCVRCAEQKSLF
jgi:hypothetical protein